jgi:hypothetical protein
MIKMLGIEGGVVAAGRSSGRDRVWAGQAVPGEVIAAGACGAGGHADQVAAEGGAAGPGVKQRGQRPDGAQDVLGDRGQDRPEEPVECAPVVSAAPTALAHRTPCCERCRRASSEVLPGVPNGGSVRVYQDFREKLTARQPERRARQVAYLYIAVSGRTSSSATHR